MGTIPDLAVIQMSNTFTSDLWMNGGSRNWDADVEDDGIQVWWNLIDSHGNDLHASDIPDDVIVNINIQFFVASKEFGETKAANTPFFEKDVLVAVGLRNDFFLDTSILIPFVEYVPLIPPDAIFSEALLGDRGNVVSIVAEIRLTQSDGSVFSDRAGVTIAVETK